MPCFTYEDIDRIKALGILSIGEMESFEQSDGVEDFLIVINKRIKLVMGYIYGGAVGPEVDYDTAVEAIEEIDKLTSGYDNDISEQLRR